jgi:chromosome segregation ATPase
MHVAETERRLNQLYADVRDAYGLLTDVGKVQAEHTKQLGTLNDTVAEHTKQLRTLNDTVAKIWTTQQQHGDRLNDLDAAVAGLGEKLTEMSNTQMRHEYHLVKIDTRFGRMDQRLEQVDQRLDQVDQRLDQVDQRFEQVDKRFEQVDKRFDEQDRKLDLILEALNISTN